MGRPIKKGLDYFPLDCHLETKFKLVEATFGLKGFALVIKLLQHIYGEEGYYMEWTQDVGLLFALENNVSGSFVSEVVNDCLKRGIFDKEMFESKAILTSAGIQKRYLKMTEKRNGSKIFEDYVILNEPKKTVNSDKTHVSSEKTHVSNGRKYTKESKVNKRKVNSNTTSMKNELFEIFESEFGRPLSEIEIESLLSMQNRHSQELVLKALKEAVLNNSKSFRYIEAILENWKSAGIRTVDEAQKQIDAFKQRKSSGANKTYPAKEKQLPSWYYDQESVPSNLEEFDEQELMQQMKALRGET